LIIPRRALTFGAALVLCAAIAGQSFAREPITFASSSIDYPDKSRATQASLQMIVEGQPVEVLPPGTIPPVPGEPRRSPEMRTWEEHEVVPLLDDCNDHDPVIGEELGDVGEYYEGGRRGVRPYGGGHPSDWEWGCGGSPFRNGPGQCDTFRVGPIWNVQVDGMVMKREGTDLQQIWNETDDGQGIPELFEQFDYAPGGRLNIVGKHPKYAGYRVHAGIEGVEKWEAVVVYPKQTLEQTTGAPDDPNAIISQLTTQRRVHYTSNLYSGELNIQRCCDPVWTPYCGVRYMKFDDELRIADNQEALGPLDVLDPPPIEVLTTDMTNLFDLENNLMGFQIGLRHDYWKINSRFAIEGFVNGGVYYNKVKYTNFMNTTTTQRLGNVTPVNNTEATNFIGTTNVVSSTNLDSSDLSEIAYSYEASISAVCRLNKCWAMRAGYQVMWINGLRLADEAFLDPDIFLDNETHSMLFQGWHAGIECRR
jgi:hypothetical protein